LSQLEGIIVLARGYYCPS